jgi:hypothetical protein
MNIPYDSISLIFPVWKKSALQLHVLWVRCMLLYELINVRCFKKNIMPNCCPKQALSTVGLVQRFVITSQTQLLFLSFFSLPSFLHFFLSSFLSLFWHFFFLDSLSKYSKLASNSRSSCLSLPRAGITDVYHHAELRRSFEGNLKSVLSVYV